MKNFDTVVDKVLIGDYSKYIFLQWLIPDSPKISPIDIDKIKEYPIWVSFAKSFAITKEDNVYKISTYKILPEQNLFVPLINANSGKPELSPFKISNSFMYILFEEFPFKKEENIIMAKNLVKDDIIVVLMDLPRRVSSTDITDIREDISLAKDTYSGLADKVVSIKSDTYINKILYWQISLKLYWQKYIKNKLKKLKERIEQVEYDYEGYLLDWEEDKIGCMNMLIRYKICSYESVIANPNKSVWQAYCDTALSYLFPKSGRGNLYDVIELYFDIMDDFLLDKNKSERRKQLLGILINNFRNQMLKERKYSCIRLIILNENEYLKIISKGHSLYGINVAFMNKYDNYINKECLKTLKNILAEEYKYFRSRLQ